MNTIDGARILSVLPDLSALCSLRAFPPIESSMFWWFRRGADYVRYESRKTDDGTYELRLVDAEGVERVELFEADRDLNDRQRELEDGLIADGWTGPHGWNL